MARVICRHDGGRIVTNPVDELHRVLKDVVLLQRGVDASHVWLVVVGALQIDVPELGSGDSALRAVEVGIESSCQATGDGGVDDGIDRVAEVDGEDGLIVHLRGDRHIVVDPLVYGNA